MPAAGLASQIVSFTSAICSTDRRELRMPGHLPAHLLHLRRRQLPAAVSAAPADRVHKNRGPCPG